ncbi:release factor glutamine methyltransferase [Alkalithermobacter thermoalcaliphilus JW-YL-7 = DSM 7308]|uniref:Release factor glutamine methyltransferase n=1 Tax=Alkalithermobacter thermoalcaliphilus JW-YL-7 = DSM 7308 TaxID=1121328 RepID=A0A150FU30_CLOPD|nr:Protein-(glutamine-N5) methyltransferase, release factor-specific [[Clostridium] paradoxum JW-YL-7 = DSM 7308]SHK71339.1 release factor glutamine methyltransferase [[Clostridium] paradoxum JW-YL-7 = DSM 7308]
MTIRKILLKSINELKHEDNIKLDIELMLCKVLSVDRLYIHMNLDKDLTKEQIDEFNKLLDQRKKGRPVQYILGKQEFMGLDFYVEEGVLIPRADTEVLVEEVINICKNIKNPTILDIGVGSGAISVSLAKYIKDCKVYSLDISEKALDIARKNAKANGVCDKITFIYSDLFSSLDKDLKFDIIVSNPPYIKKEEFETLDIKVKNFEPEIALLAEDNGLIFYKKITKEGYNYLKKGAVLAYEVGHDQAKDVGAIMKENGFFDIRYVKDLQGIDRVVIGVKF